MTIHTRGNIGVAMSNYNKTHGHYFITIDPFIICAVLEGAYTTDQELAHISISSLSTAKRSINRLCDFGILKKHISKINEKTLTVDHEVLTNFLSQYLEGSVVHV